MLNNNDNELITTEEIAPQETEAEPKLEPIVKPTEQPPVKLSVYDLIYGSLFDPTSTYRKVGVNPPVSLTIMLVLGLNLVLAIMGMFTADYQPIAEDFMGYTNNTMLNTMQSFAPMITMAGFVINALIWFAYSALLHLIAEFYGGKGRAIATFTVYGLAGLPSLLLLPLQGLEIIFAESTVFSMLAIIGALAVTIWGIVLLVIGIREVHRLTTGKAVLVVITPWLLGIVLAIIMAIMLVGVLSSAMPQLEQFGKM